MREQRKAEREAWEQLQKQKEEEKIIKTGLKLKKREIVKEAILNDIDVDEIPN